MKIKAGFGTIVIVLFSIVSACAQGLPCGGDDPDATCPLDTWVILLVIVASAFAAYTLYRRQAVSRSNS